MMKLKCLIAILSIVTAAGVETAKGEDGIDFEFTSDFLSKYIWRGQNVDDDPVFQPGLSIAHKNLTASVWGNFEFTNINGNRGDFTELDYTLDYSGTVPGIEGLGYSIGLIYYDFPGTAAEGTTEVYLGFSCDLPLNPSLTIYRDIDEANGSYISLAFSHSIEKIGRLGVDTPIGMKLGASISWGNGSYNKYYWGTDQTEINDLGLSVSFPFEAAGWTVAPSLNYVTLLSDDIRATDAYGTDSDFFVVGIGLIKTFK